MHAAGCIRAGESAVSTCGRQHGCRVLWMLRMRDLPAVQIAQIMMEIGPQARISLSSATMSCIGHLPAANAVIPPVGLQSYTCTYLPMTTVLVRALWQNSHENRCKFVGRLLQSGMHAAARPDTLSHRCRIVLKDKKRAIAGREREGHCRSAHHQDAAGICLALRSSSCPPF